MNVLVRLIATGYGRELASYVYPGLLHELDLKPSGLPKQISFSYELINSVCIHLQGCLAIWSHVLSSISSLLDPVSSRPSRVPVTKKTLGICWWQQWMNGWMNEWCYSTSFLRIILSYYQLWKKLPNFNTTVNFFSISFSYLFFSDPDFLLYLLLFLFHALSLKSSFPSCWSKGKYQCTLWHQNFILTHKIQPTFCILFFKTFDIALITKYCHVCFPIWKLAERR